MVLVKKVVKSKVASGQEMAAMMLMVITVTTNIIAAISSFDFTTFFSQTFKATYHFSQLGCFTSFLQFIMSFYWLVCIHKVLTHICSYVTTYMERTLKQGNTKNEGLYNVE